LARRRIYVVLETASSHRRLGLRAYDAREEHLQICTLVDKFRLNELVHSTPLLSFVLRNLERIEEVIAHRPQCAAPLPPASSSPSATARAGLLFRELTRALAGRFFWAKKMKRRLRLPVAQRTWRAKFLTKDLEGTR
jgi:hypothetical protein